MRGVLNLSCLIQISVAPRGFADAPGLIRNWIRSCFTLSACLWRSRKKNTSPLPSWGLGRFEDTWWGGTLSQWAVTDWTQVNVRSNRYRLCGILGEESPLLTAAKLTFVPLITSPSLNQQSHQLLRLLIARKTRRGDSSVLCDSQLKDGARSAAFPSKNIYGNYKVTGFRFIEMEQIWNPFRTETQDIQEVIKKTFRWFSERETQRNSYMRFTYPQTCDMIIKIYKFNLGHEEKHFPSISCICEDCDQVVWLTYNRWRHTAIDFLSHLNHFSTKSSDTIWTRRMGLVMKLPIHCRTLNYHLVQSHRLES